MRNGKICKDWGLVRQRGLAREIRGEEVLERGGGCENLDLDCDIVKMRVNLLTFATARRRRRHSTRNPRLKTPLLPHPPQTLRTCNTPFLSRDPLQRWPCRGIWQW